MAIPFVVPLTNVKRSGVLFFVSRVQPVDAFLRSLVVWLAMNFDVLESSWVSFSGVPDVRNLSPFRNEMKLCGEVLCTFLQDSQIIMRKHWLRRTLLRKN